MTLTRRRRKRRNASSRAATRVKAEEGRFGKISGTQRREREGEFAEDDARKWNWAWWIGGCDGESFPILREIQSRFDHPACPRKHAATRGLYRDDIHRGERLVSQFGTRVTRTERANAREVTVQSGK